MKLNVYVIKDLVMEQCWNLAEAKNDVIASREFQKLMEKQDFPDDFEMWCVGWFDHDSMELSVCEPRKVVLSLESEVEEDVI